MQFDDICHLSGLVISKNMQSKDTLKMVGGHLYLSILISLNQCFSDAYIISRFDLYKLNLEKMSL